MIRVVLGGLEARGGYAPMPAVGVGMIDKQVADAVDYVRQAWGNKAPATAGGGAVADLRKNTVSSLNGAQGECVTSSEIATANKVRSAAGAELRDVNLTNMSKKIEELLPKLRAKQPDTSDDAIQRHDRCVLSDRAEGHQDSGSAAHRPTRYLWQLVHGRLKNGANQN